MHSIPADAAARVLDSDCPHLGMASDSQTRLAFPSQWNLCHHGARPEPVALDHQRLFCQSSQHTQCQVFQRGSGGGLPSGVRAHKTSPSIHRRRGWKWFALPLLAVLTIGAALLAAWGWWTGAIELPFLPKPPSPRQASTGLPVSSLAEAPATVPARRTTTPDDAAQSIVTEVPLGAATGAASGSTPLADSIAPGQCGHRLDEQFGSNPELLIHRVGGGDSLNMYAASYETSVEVLQALNFDLRIPIRDQSVLVIAPGLLEVVDLPTFEAYEVTEAGISLQSVSATLSIPADRLLGYNSFDAGCETVRGWLVIPHE